MKEQLRAMKSVRKAMPKPVIRFQDRRRKLLAKINKKEKHNEPGD